MTMSVGEYNGCNEVCMDEFDDEIETMPETFKQMEQIGRDFEEALAADDYAKMLVLLDQILEALQSLDDALHEVIGQMAVPTVRAYLMMMNHQGAQAALICTSVLEKLDQPLPQALIDLGVDDEAVQTFKGVVTYIRGMSNLMNGETTAGVADLKASLQAMGNDIDVETILMVRLIEKELDVEILEATTSLDDDEVDGFATALLNKDYDQALELAYDAEDKAAVYALMGDLDKMKECLGEEEMYLAYRTFFNLVQGEYLEAKQSAKSEYDFQWLPVIQFLESQNQPGLLMAGMKA